MREPTMADIAARLGVSRQLVSIALRGLPGASSETRERVQKVAEDLGYRPHLAARSLRQAKSRHIGVAFAPAGAAEADLVEAIYPAAAEHGYQLVLSARTGSRSTFQAVDELRSVLGAFLTPRPRQFAPAVVDDSNSAHLVAGFGRIIDLAAADLLTDLAGAEALVDAEAEIVAHMNAEHPAATRLYATRLLGESDGEWRCVGCDPDGLELQWDRRARRLNFAQRVASPGVLRQVLKGLAEEARLQG